VTTRGKRRQRKKDKPLRFIRIIDYIEPMMLTQPELGRKLRALREERGLSLRELAAAAGVSHNSIYSIETARVKKPRPKAWRRICRVLSVSVGYFKK